MRFKLLYLLFVCYGAAALSAQNDGQLQFVGHAFFNDRILPHTEVKVLSGGKLLSKTNTGENGDFRLDLPFGKIYDICLGNRRTQPMFLRVLAQDVPASKQQIRMTYELDIPFFPRDAKNIDTTRFSEPFHRIYFDGKKRFVDDTLYMNAFLAKLYLHPTHDSLGEAPIAVKSQTGTLVGTLLYDTPDKTPLQNRLVRLEDKAGKLLSDARTTRNGTFVFRQISLDEASFIRVQMEESESLVQKILIRNSQHEVLASTTMQVGGKQASFENTANNNLMKRLVDNLFAYKIAGKIAAGDGQHQQTVSEAYVYLLNDKNTVVQKVKTNMLGSFVFTNIKPNQHYSLAVADTNCKTPGNCRLILYNARDKRLRDLDSVVQHRFLYRFLAVSGEAFDDLLADDNDLKMNVKGKMYGNNTNNPLSELQVLILNANYEVIDSTRTGKDGSFSFRYLPYMQGFSLSSANSDHGLDAFNNIMVYDNSNNLIKIVTLVKGSKFSYRPLPTEQGRFAEIFVDDAWLGLIDKNYLKKTRAPKELIIENIRFGYDKSEILPQAQKVLDKVLLALKLNPGLDLELGAHTDCKGSDAYNLKLSEARAQSALKYLTDNGADPKRLRARGYGESRLLNRCDDGVPCPEEEHAQNRRIEFVLNFAN